MKLYSVIFSIFIPSMLGLWLNSAVAETPRDVLVIGWNVDSITTFDPAQFGEIRTREIYNNMCASLVYIDPEDPTKLVPGIAESWSISPDNLTITFHLRKNLYFSSGRLATAQDVVWSMQRIVKLGLGNAITLTDYGFTSDRVSEAITAPDDTKVVLRFNKSYPPMLALQSIAATEVASVLDRDVLMKHEVNGDIGNAYLANHTECLGPYRLSEWRVGNYVLLQANDKWFQPPVLKRVLIRHVVEAGTQRLMLEKGDIDVARDFGTGDINELSTSPNIRIVKTLTPTLILWIFNTADPVLGNEKVRLAMRYLIDYDGLAKTTMEHIGMPRASFVPLGAFGALGAKEGTPFRLDLEKAKVLLTEAGYGTGFKINLIYGTLSYVSPIVQNIQANAAKIGVNIVLDKMPNAQLFSRVRGRNFQSSVGVWTSVVPDAHFNASRLVYNNDNRSDAKLVMMLSWRASFQSEDLNRQIDAALMERDIEKRVRIYHDLQKQVMQEGPMAFMFQIYDVAAISTKLSNWKGNGFRTYYNLVSK